MQNVCKRIKYSLQRISNPFTQSYGALKFVQFYSGTHCILYGIIGGVTLQAICPFSCPTYQRMLINRQHQLYNIQGSYRRKNTVFQDLQRPNSRVFQDSKNAFSRTFQDTLHSQTQATFPPQGREHSPLCNGLGVTAAAACYGTYAREISLLVLLLPRGQQE